MTTLQLEVYEAFRSIDVPEEKAVKVAASLSTAFGKANPEQDAKIATLATDVASIKTDVLAIKLDNAAIRGELSVVKWMGGVLITMVTAILFKLFLH